MFCVRVIRIWIMFLLHLWNQLLLPSNVRKTIVRWSDEQGNLQKKSWMLETVKRFVWGHLSACGFMKHKELMNNEKMKKTKIEKETKSDWKQSKKKKGRKAS